MNYIDFDSIGGILIIKKLKEYREQILYLIFGGFTTLVNIITYALLTRVFLLDNITSNIYAWIISVFFAYLTNKLFVFRSNALDMKTIVKELISFISCRLLSGIMDISIMYVFVNLLHFNDIVIKIISNTIVVIVNYLFSKLIIFKKSK